MSQLCVIFDLDGTLCSTSEVDDECYRSAAAAALGVQAAEIDWIRADHITDSGIAHWLWNRFRSRPPSGEELHRLKGDFLRRLESERSAAPVRFRAVDSASSFVEELQGAGVALGIGTGGWRVTAELKLMAAGLDTHLLRATADDAHARAEIFGLARSRTAAVPGPQTTVLVGDGVWDVATACELGWRFLGVGAGASAARLHEAGAAVVIPDYSRRDAVDTIQRARIPSSAGR
jgi:phosphoglycolate phosphatase-like HAD superfamily hydrolase